MTLLAIRDLRRQFGGLRAVDGVSLDVAAGEILAVIGPNGAGKSTLLHLVAGIEAPTRGSIVLDGQDITARRPDQIRRLGVATVMQRPRDFASMTVSDAVLVGAVFGSRDGRPDRHTARATVDRMLAALDITAIAHRRVGEVTAYERRLCRLAAALAGHPRVLLADEIMAGLDPAEIAATSDVLARARYEHAMTVVLVEHVLPAVTALADRIAVLDFGRLLVEGPPDRVLADPAVAAAYLGHMAVGAGREDAGANDQRGDRPADPTC